MLYPAGWDVGAEACCNFTCVTFLHLNLNKDSVLLHYIGHTLVLVMQSLTWEHHLWSQAPQHQRICRWGIKFPFITLFPSWESSLCVDHELFSWYWLLSLSKSFSFCMIYHDILTIKKRVTKCAFHVDASTWGLMMVCLLGWCAS